MFNRSPVQRALARLSSLCGSPRAWMLLLALLTMAPDAARAACGTFNVPDANTTPSTSPMASGGSIAINIGYQCDPFGLNPQSFVTQPTHGSVTLSGTDNTIVNYANNGDGATTDSFVVQDASGNPFTVNVAIGAATSPITVSPASLPTPNVGTSYSQSLSSTGGTAPYSYALTAGALPSGLTLSGSTISGTPNQAGSYNATITVTDNVGTTGTKSYAFTVPNPSSSIAVVAPPTAALNTAYSYDLNANTSGALAPYTYSQPTSGALPPGLALSGTTISGTPTTVGTYNFSLTVTDASPGPGGPYFKSVNLSITVQNIPPVANSVSATVAYDSTSNPITLNITGGAATSVAIGTAASHGTATASGTSITYTPTTGYAGPDSFTYTATNGAGTSSPATATITVSPPTLVYTPAAPPHASAGVAYSHSITGASGGAAPYTYAVTSGALPAGLALASDGTLSGTATAAGTFNFTVTATDSSTGTGPFSIGSGVTLVVDAPTILIAPATLPNGTFNAAYGQTVTASGGTAPYSYAVTTGSLPNGLSLSSTGALSGTPTQAGDYPITITATDSTTGAAAPYTGSQSYTLHIDGPAITVAPGTVPNATVGTAYSQTLSASGGTGPYTFAATGSVPPGLTLSAGGNLSGTPTTAGDFSFTATATDADSFTGNQAYTVHVTAIAPAAPTGASATAGDTQASVSFAAPTNTGGAPISSYTVTSSPGGFTATGSASPITVTGLTNGTAYTFTVTATNTAGTGPASTPSNAVTPKGAQTITFNNPGTQNFGTTPTLSATASSGLTPTFSSQTTGVCTITSGGALTFLSAGTCTVSADQAGDGTYLAAPTVTQSFTVAAVVPGAPTIGAASAGDAQATVSFVAPASNGGATITAYTVTSNPGGITGTGAASPIAVTGLTNGTAYTFTVTATNSAGTGSASAASNSVTPLGTQTITFNNPGSQNFGTSPQMVASASSGLTVSFSSTTSAVCTVTSAGVLTTVAPGTCSIQADQAGNGAYQPASAVTQSFAIVVPGGAVSFSTASPLPGATAESVYSQTITAAGGATPYTFSLVSGSLPTGVTFSSSGALSGTPLASGTFNFTLRVTDAATQTADKAYQLVVTAPAIALAPVTLSGGQVAQAYAQTLTASGGVAPYTFAVTTGALPAGLTLSAAGTLSGTPTAAGSFNVTVTATDQHGFQGSQAYTLGINQPVPVAVDDSASVNSNGHVTINVTANDSGPITSVAITQQPTHGTATINGLDVVYTPAANYFGSDTLKYTATGPGGTSGAATASITVVPNSVSFPAAQLPDATAEATYSHTFAASNGIAPYTYQLSGGALPGGLVLAPDGTLSGTPVEAGTFSFTVHVTDTAGQTADQSFQLTVASPSVTVAPGSVPAGTVGTVYSQVLSASGGVAPYTFAVTTGALPAGLTLSAAGTLSGTPTAAGSFNVTVTATDQHGFQGSQAYTLGINQPVPVAVDDTASVNSNGHVTIAVTANDSGPITSIAITQQPAHGTATVSGLDVVYSPAANYFGSDTLKYTATGPGGTSGAATVSITVVPGAVPVAAAQTAKVLAGKSVTIHAAAGATNGPFTGAAITSAPTSGTAVVQGTDIVYTADPNASGTFGLDYTLSNAFGTSQPAHVTLAVNPRPVAPALNAKTIAGVTVQVDLTTAARGGPFTAANVVSIMPANAGTATVRSSNGGYTLAFTPAATFGGVAKVTYTLSNAFATSEPGTVDITVELRRDPSKDPEVTGVLDAQAEATHRMAMGQINNFQRRLESLHNGSSRGGFSNGITMSSASSLRRQPLAIDGRQGMGSAGDPFLMPTDGAMTNPSVSGNAAPGGVSFWAGGAVNFGKLQPGASDNGIDFTTSGLSLGADKQVSQALTLGVGAGYGHDVSDVGQHGSRSAVDSYNVAVYGSYQPGESIYVDALAGYQWLQFDARRFVTDNGNTVHGSRDGKQWFASLSVGYQHQAKDMMLTPYGRLDVARAALDGYTETGDAVFALRYEGQTVKTSTANLGLLAQWSVKRDYGMWTPQLRAEFGHDMQGASVATMRYADLLTGPLYQATLSRQSRNHTIVGAGFTLQTYKGWSLRAEYQAQIDNTSRDNQSIQLGVQKALQP
ncbi:MAG: hypothetical protein ABT16_01590 [Rhodanobacter sp. SCN 65-17]|nr:MAG: hypothetical protein ABT16_01590 [Rhodanobacter sp. SCN 65-17]